MRTLESEFKCMTAGESDIVDITEEVQSAIVSSGISDGHVTISATDETVGIVVNERESGLMADLRRAIKRFASDGPVPVGSRLVVLPAEQGRLRLGTWQRVLLIELGAGAERWVKVRIEGE